MRVPHNEISVHGAALGGRPGAMNVTLGAQQPELSADADSHNQPRGLLAQRRISSKKEKT